MSNNSSRNTYLAEKKHQAQTTNVATLATATTMRLSKSWNCHWHQTKHSSRALSVSQSSPQVSLHMNKHFKLEKYGPANCTPTWRAFENCHWHRTKHCSRAASAEKSPAWSRAPWLAHKSSIPQQNTKYTAVWKPNFPAQIQPGVARSPNQHDSISPELPGVPVPYPPLATDSTGLQPHARNWARALENYKVLTNHIKPGVGPRRPFLAGNSIVRGEGGVAVQLKICVSLALRATPRACCYREPRRKLLGPSLSLASQATTKLC